MTISSRFDYLKVLMNRGGPERSEYADTMDCFRSVAGAVRDGKLTRRELRGAWYSLGDAFSSTRTMQGHVVRRPYGYPGDFDLIDKIYRQYVSPDPTLARWDEFFHAQAACQAVRDRKTYFLDHMAVLRGSAGDKPLSVLAVGCGPAREVYEHCTTDDDACQFTCVDRDSNAARYARSLNAEFSKCVDVVEADILEKAAGIDQSKFDLIWCAGIFDYFSDTRFVRALRNLLPYVRGGGGGRSSSRISILPIRPENTWRAASGI